MAPPKSSRTAGDDHKPDSASSTKEKGSGNHHPTSTKMRRGASQNSVSQTKESATVAPTSAPARNLSETQVPTIDWSSFERETLHSYRREHQLSTPAAFASKFHHTVMSLPGSIGRYSPTMVRKQQNRRQSKEGLAKAVRKHFNGLGIQENDVILEFICKIGCGKTSGQSSSVPDH
ncbi:hypothetical protein AAL_01485 [Moelleriella libera RCEF 2490]|uniref:Histone deacetylase complex subunit SAP30 Sin3 binding domain-containing protein n=1 Tax=Moelleriella libera RCEF 2490 TaxID=1081109 RepID=A0A166U7I8_9HYPO|nr:hypothetical protein AAL_01485 [Moelleriella libera RCEF 2490]